MSDKKSVKQQAVENFKVFARKYPLLAKEVKAGNKTWQDFFEEWYLLGENDSYWNEFKEKTEEKKVEAVSATQEEKKSVISSELVGQILTALKGVDLNSLQGHIQNLNGVITNVQGLVRTFTGGKESTEQTNTVETESLRPKPPVNPFYFHKD